MKRLLWVGDAGCPSGFALATHKILETLHRYYDVTVLGINYLGDPHSYPYPIYAAAPGGDFFGIGRLVWLCDIVKPDVIVVQQDGWNVPHYVNHLMQFPEYRDVPVIAIVAIDGKNFRGEWLTGVSLAVFWTQFALDEAREGGYDGPAVVIPLGVDLEMFHQSDKREARNRILPVPLDDAFIVGNVNRNQPRKRWDLTLRYFAGWVKTKKVADAYLYLHAAPTGDTSINVKKLAQYYGVLDRVIFREPNALYGVSEAEMRDTYNCFDLAISTTQGEGMGLTAMEAMACGVPCILPDWAALGEWAKGASWLVPCTSTAIGPPYVNVIGGVPDEASFISALHALYTNPSYCEQNRAAGLERVTQERFRWPNIAQRYHTAIEEMLTSAPCRHQWIEVTVFSDEVDSFKCIKCGEKMTRERPTLKEIEARLTQ